MILTASEERLGGSRLLRKSANTEKSGMRVPTREDLRGKTVRLSAVDDDGEPVEMEMDAADAWKDTQEKLATYRKLQRAMHDGND